MPASKKIGQKAIEGHPEGPPEFVDVRIDLPKREH